MTQERRGWNKSGQCDRAEGGKLAPERGTEAKERAKGGKGFRGIKE